ncbi:MAG: primosomal protein N' [Synechococcaceae cyanobacterium]|nr:primosomal protein N' [Synechococcaceae cyanobacterium]
MEAGREGRTFTYGLPEGQAAQVGDLVQVRLQGRPHAGLVVAQHERVPAALEEVAIQPIVGVLQHAAVDPRWQRLIAEVAHDCHTTVFRTLKSALPPGWLGQRSRPSPGPRPQRQVVRCCGEGVAATPRQRQLLERLEQAGGQMPLRQLLDAEGFGRGIVSALERQGLIRLQNRTVAAGTSGQLSVAPASSRTANRSQAEALEQIGSAPAGAQLLLWGVTGSGKTEVYLEAAAAELRRGRSVLLLAPEIALIPQLLDRARGRFGASVLEYHSGRSEGDRVRAWRRCLEEAAAGMPTLVVGTRSAVFLPLGHLGLIVLDEEHDSSYKQESPMPCYHARTVAEHRTRLEGARLLLGSATPCLETWLRQKRGEIQLLRLPQRIGGRPPAVVRLVDMRSELAEGHRRLISRALMGRLEQLPARREQAVILVPRRGYRTFLSCRSCGEAVLCPHCDVALTVHRGREDQEWLRCHWCDHRQSLGDRCGACGSRAFKPFGAGTQRVVEQLGVELAGLRLLRFDHDSTRGRDGHRQVLERFAAGEADVLVGTQMLAKGMDLPRVTLAAVLAADGLLHRPDLRASEQCLQLLLQLAGRAGRGEIPGEVLVQTYNPDHPVIRHLVDGRYERFAEAELALRQTGEQVPFQRACLLRLAGPSPSGTATSAAALVERIRAMVRAAGWAVIGPAPAPVARVAGRSRWQVLLHGPASASRALPLPPEGELRALLPPTVSLAIDPDPLNL